MASSGPDRSITSISLPQWMKSKISDRYDLEQTAFSPPSNDDGFFLVKYKKALPEHTEPPSVTSSTLTTIGSEAKQPFQIKSHLGQHTTSCQKFISNSKIAPREIGMRHGVDTSLHRIKSTGTDDGFKGEGAACGYSVVAVAHQMIAERTGENKLAAPPMNQRIRRNSKSLPASPQGSPKLLRKNPYFTNIIFGSSEIVDNENNSILRGSVEELGKWAAVNRTLSDGGETTSNTTINSRSTSKLSSLSNTMTTSSITGQVQQPLQPNQQQQILNRQLYTPPPSSSAAPNAGSALGQIVTLKAKPSHLREMNFWSPTSM